MVFWGCVSITSGFHKTSVSYHDVTPAELCRPVLIRPVIYQSAGVASCPLAPWGDWPTCSLLVCPGWIPDVTRVTSCKSTRHHKWRWTQTTFPSLILLSPVSKCLVSWQDVTLDPHPDSSQFSFTSLCFRGTARPSPPSSSTPGIKLKIHFHHTHAQICKDVIV